MGRPKAGWKLRQKPGRPFEVRFTHDGAEHNHGLGTRDRREAEEKAARVYADTIHGAIVPKRVAQVATAVSFEQAGGEWLAEATSRLREKTVATYEVYLLLLGKTFETLADCTTPSMERFISRRLSEVQAQTLRKEMAVLRSVLQFSHGRGWMRDMPFVPNLPKRAKGTRFKLRRRVSADALSPEEIEALLAALPDWSTSKKIKQPFPIRARFVVGYDQAMRPELLSRLEVPLNWSKGRTGIWVPSEHDKTGRERTIPLTERSIAALEGVAPESGLLFGDHDYRPAMRKAAEAALPEHKAKRFCGQHLRSAGLTHLAEMSLVGAQSVGGHARVSTTALYVRPSERAAAEVIDMASRKRRLG
jgi:integrase